MNESKGFNTLKIISQDDGKYCIESTMGDNREMINVHTQVTKEDTIELVTNWIHDSQLSSKDLIDKWINILKGK